MNKLLPALALFMILAAPPARAEEEIVYFQDPLYKKINADDEHPMSEMYDLAENGDVHAQFILGNLYSKGQGGLPKSAKLARQWFEAAARNGYGYAFVRLAALEKHAKDPVNAYKWYTLGIQALQGGDRKWAVDARDALEKDADMTRDQVHEAKRAAAEWRKAKPAPLPPTINKTPAKPADDAAAASADTAKDKPSPAPKKEDTKKEDKKS